MRIQSLLVGGIFLLSSCDNSPVLDSEVIEPYAKSIDYWNKAYESGNKYSSDVLSEDAIREWVMWLEKALIEAEKVDVELIESEVTGFSFHYQNEYIKGLRLTISGYKNGSQDFITGQQLMDDWLDFSETMPQLKRSKN